MTASSVEDRDRRGALGMKRVTTRPTPPSPIGESVPRRDARAKVTGAAQFTVDLGMPGLAHAKLCAEASAALTLAAASSSLERDRDALARLIAFRREHARGWIANFNPCSWVEDRSWRLPRALPR